MRSMKTDLRNIPGVGKSIEQDLIDIGINCVNDLKGRDPEDLYLRDAAVKGIKSDPLVQALLLKSLNKITNNPRKHVVFGGCFF